MWLIALLRGAIITGMMYTVEPAASGAIVAALYALERRQLMLRRLAEAAQSVMKLAAIVFILLIGDHLLASADVYVTHLSAARVAPSGRWPR